MKSIIQNALYQGLKTLSLNQTLTPSTIQIEYTKNPQHGDFSSNIALSLAKSARLSPRELAEKIKETLLTETIHNGSKLFVKIEVAGPGFINFFLSTDAWLPTITTILKKKEHYGQAQIGENKKILVEFVSSNPTGPLHVGHGRHAVHGDVLVRLLQMIGYQVHREYYVNDAGRQMDILTCSVWLRYLEQGGEIEFLQTQDFALVQGESKARSAATLRVVSIADKDSTPKSGKRRSLARSLILKFPENAYQGDYVSTIAAQLRIQYNAQFQCINKEKIEQILAAAEGLDPDKQIDALIQYTKSSLGNENYQLLNEFSLQAILEDMKADLSEFNVIFDEWFSEKSLFTTGAVTEVIDTLTHRGHTYSSEGMLWFKSTCFGDDKDRVLIRANGQATYFAADAAYRLNILQKRKFDQIINILGADHHGYTPRIRAVIEALGYDPDQVLKVGFIQFVALYRGQEKLSMSTRKGSFISLRELRHEVGHDAARLFYMMRKSEQHLNFDLALAKSQSQENPVYYLQYAYARMCSIMRQLEAKGYTWELSQGLASLHHLTLSEEINLIKQLARYPENINQSATLGEPQLLTQYLRELAQGFHSYYNQIPLLVSESSMRSARISLMQAVKQVFENSFHLLGVSMPNIM